MDFSLKGMDDVIRHGRREENKYILYAFVLSANVNTKKFLNALINLFSLINGTTGKEILVIAPEIDIGKEKGIRCSTSEIIEILETGTYYNYSLQESVDVSFITRDFIRRYIDQSTTIARDYEILDELPVILFAGSLSRPSKDECFIFSIKNKSASDVAEFLREISHLCQISSKRYYEKKCQLTNIRSKIDRIRFCDAKREEERKNRQKEQKVASAQKNADRLAQEIESRKKKLKRLRDGNGYRFFCPYRNGYFAQDNSLKIDSISKSLYELGSQHNQAVATVSKESNRDVSISIQRLAEIETHNIKMRESLKALRKKEAMLITEIDSLRPTPSSVVAPLVRSHRVRSLSSSMFKIAKELLPFLRFFK